MGNFCCKLTKAEQKELAAAREYKRQRLSVGTKHSCQQSPTLDVQEPQVMATVKNAGTATLSQEDLVSSPKAIHETEIVKLALNQDKAASHSDHTFKDSAVDLFFKNNFQRFVNGTSIEPSPVLTRDLAIVRSYRHKSNTCYLTSLLELLFASLSWNWHRNKHPIDLEVLKAVPGHPFSRVALHLQKRYQLAGKDDKRSLVNCLKKGLDNLARFAIVEEELYEWMEYGTPTVVGASLHI